MKVSRKWFIPAGKLVAALGAPVLPIAVVVACGESSTESVSLDSYDNIVKFLKTNISANLDFTNDAVGWRSNVKNDAQISYRYLSGNYPTIAAVKAADPAAWLVTPPSSVSPQHDERNLWVEVISTNPAINITGDARFIDLTASSEIQKIKTQVDLIPEYTTIDFNNAELIGSYSYPEISLTDVKIPVGVGLVYRTANTDWMPQGQFISYLKNNSDAAAEFSSVSVRTQSSDLNKFVVRVPREGTIRNSLVARPSYNLDFVAKLENVKVDLTNSNNKNVSWTGLEDVASSTPETISKVEFYYGVQTKNATIVEVASSEWKAFLPTTLNDRHESRNLWVKITPKTVNTANPVTYYNLTFSSNVRQVKTEVTFLEGFFSVAEVAGRRGVVSINRLPVLSPGVDVVFQITGKTPFMKLTELITYLNTNAATLTIKDYYNIYVKLVLVSDSNLYILPNDHLTNLRNVMSFTGGTPFELFAALDSIRVHGSTPTAVPRNTEMKWSSTSLTIPSTVESVSYYIGRINSTADVSDLPEDEWLTALPSSIPFNSGTNLWARVKFKVAGAFTEYFDITSSSGLYFVYWVISSDPKYNNPAAWENIPHQIKRVTKQTATTSLDFTLYLDEDPDKEVFTSEYYFLRAWYSYNGGAWVDKAAVIAQIKADPTKQLRIMLDNNSSNRFVVDNNWIIDANITNWSEYI